MSEDNAKARGSLVKDLSTGPLDVELSSEALSNPFLQQRLKDLGKDLAPGGYAYKGSLCVHIYVSNIAKEASFIHQVVGMENIPESVASFGVGDLALKTRQTFNPDFKHKTRNAKDKR